MAATLTAICVVVLLIGFLTKRIRDRHVLEQHCISPEALHALLRSKQPVVLFDIRLPLDLLAHSEIIPGAIRISPGEVRENPLLIPKDQDSIVYCTCPSEEASRTVLHQALAMGYSRVKFLKGGLEGWKAKGFPVEPYEKSFHLDTGT